MDVLPECQDLELERNVHKLNRGKRPKLATVAMEKLQNCDRPLYGAERGEMSIGRQWGTVESMILLKKGPTKEEKEDKVTSTTTTSPKPAPKAPFEVDTFAADPSSSSQNC